MFCGWLGGFAGAGTGAKTGRLLTLDEVGGILLGLYAQNLYLLKIFKKPDRLADTEKCR